MLAPHDWELESQPYPATYSRLPHLHEQHDPPDRVTEPATVSDSDLALAHSAVAHLRGPQCSAGRGSHRIFKRNCH